MSLARTTLLNGCATAVRLGAGLVVNKLLSVYVGPAGFGIIGQFQSLMAMVGAASGAVLSSGVTKLTAEHGRDPAMQERVWRAALALGVGGAVVSGLVVLTLREPLARHLLGDAALAPALNWLAVAAALMALNTILLAALSGLKQVGAYVTANVAGSLLGVGAAAWLLPRYGLQGGLVALCVMQMIAGAATTLVFVRVRRSPWLGLVGRPDPAVMHALRGFAIMAATTAVAVPASLLVVREGLTRLGGPELAGQWQAMWKLSETHLLLLTTSLSLHFLPRFAEIRQGSALAAEVARGYRFVLPLVVITATVIYLLREPLTLLLFTPEFLPLVQALGAQLVGDVLKIGSWVPAFTMISHARTRLYVVTEIGFAALVAVACLLGARAAGLPGAAVGYMLTYALYWALLHWQLRVLVHRLEQQNTPQAA